MYIFNELRESTEICWRKLTFHSQGFDFFFFFFPSWQVVFQLSLFCNTFFEEESHMRFFLAFFHVFSVSSAFPDASCVGARFYCMSIQCFTGNLSICDFCFWRRCSYSLWQLSVWDMWFLLAIFQQAFWDKLFMQPGWSSIKVLAFTAFFWIFYFYFFSW